MRLVLSGYSMHSSLFCCWDQTPWARKLREEFIWAYTSRGMIRVCDGRIEAGPEAEGSHLQLQAWSGENKLEWQGPLKPQSPPPSETLPPTRPQLMNLTKQCHRLETKCSKAQNYGGQFSFTHHSMEKGKNNDLLPWQCRLKTKTNKNKTLELGQTPTLGEEMYLMEWS